MAVVIIAGIGKEQMLPQFTEFMGCPTLYRGLPKAVSCASDGGELMPEDRDLSHPLHCAFMMDVIRWTASAAVSITQQRLGGARTSSAQDG
mmetsp:Transcript_9028/g.11877  ORF Transcript_9028/g.11877 Transcript_9028/m.11877 type:complete len:91 (+) Transcript_9028:414-686(+)